MMEILSGPRVVILVSFFKQECDDSSIEKKLELVIYRILIMNQTLVSKNVGLPLLFFLAVQELQIDVAPYCGDGWISSFKKPM